MVEEEARFTLRTVSQRLWVWSRESSLQCQAASVSLSLTVRCATLLLSDAAHRPVSQLRLRHRPAVGVRLPAPQLCGTAATTNTDRAPRIVCVLPLSAEFEHKGVHLMSDGMPSSALCPTSVFIIASLLCTLSPSDSRM